MRIAAATGLVLLAVALAAAGPVAQVERRGVELALSVDKEVYAPAEPVQVELVVRNPGPGAVTFQFSDSQRYDFAVYNDRGALVWYWSRDKMFAQVLGSLTLAPGEERRYRERWDQQDTEGRRVPPGQYWVVGLFPPQRPVPPEVTGVAGPRLSVRIGLPGAELPGGYRKVFRPGRVRVRFFPWAPEGQVQALLNSLGVRLERQDAGGFAVVRTRDRNDTWEVVRQLNRSALVEWAVPDYVLLPRRR
jgi:hypothetical protein